MDFVIIGIGLLICAIIGFALSLKKDYKTLKPLKHYEENRDEITEEQAGVEESDSDDVPDEDEDDEGEYSGGGFARIITSFVGLIIGIVLVSNVMLPVMKQVQDMNATSPYDQPFMQPAFAAIFTLIPIVMIVGFVLALFGGSSPSDDEEDEDKRHKAIKHYSNERDKITKAQLRKGVKKKKTDLDKVFG